MRRNAILSTPEASILTIKLGESWFGHTDYDNANSRALEVMQRGQNPDRIPVVLEQIRRSQQVLAPYVGRIVTGKTSTLVFYEHGEWSEMRFNGSDHAVERATGVISGIEAHQVRHRYYDNLRGNLTEFDFSRNPSRATFGFRIGVVLRRLELPLSFGTHHVDPAPAPDRVMIPIHDFSEFGGTNYLASRLE